MTRLNSIRHKYTNTIFDKSIVDQSAEIILCCLALLLTIADLIVRFVLFATKKTLYATAGICYAVLLMSIFILVYLVGMGVYLALGPGFSTHFS